MKKTKNILFTGGRSPYTLELIRLFANEGYRCIVAESLKNNVSGASKYVYKNLYVPPPAQATEHFISEIIDIIREYKIELVIPTCEETFYLGMYKSKIEKLCPLFTGDINTLKRLHSKFEFVELLKEAGIKYLESKNLTSLEQVKEELKDRDTFVLKPEFSRFACNVIVNDKNKTKDMNISEQNPWVLQKFLKGKAYCSYSVALNGKITAHSIYSSIYRAGGGATIHFESVKVPQIDEIVAKIAKILNFTGQLSFDFIENEEDGICYPIECNPRTTSGTYLFTESDHLPKAFFEQEIENTIVPTSDTPRMVGLAMIIYYLPTLRDFNGLQDFITKLSKSKDVIFNPSDVKPFISQFTSLMHYFKQAKKHKITVLEASTVDIEWNGR
jgi:carbamoylphosphate synthase large subunit